MTKSRKTPPSLSVFFFFFFFLWNFCSLKKKTKEGAARHGPGRPYDGRGWTGWTDWNHKGHSFLSDQIIGWAQEEKQSRSPRLPHLLRRNKLIINFNNINILPWFNFFLFPFFFSRPLVPVLGGREDMRSVLPTARHMMGARTLCLFPRMRPMWTGLMQQPWLLLSKTSIPSPSKTFVQMTTNTGVSFRSFV